jgi:SAM-dependent methyltransferase
MLRRSGDARFATRYFVGDAIDIGAGDDSLEHYQNMFPLLNSVRPYDKIDGDAQLMTGVYDNSFDCVHSSHCLEHMVDPFRAFDKWLKLCRYGGHVVIVVPDFVQYEGGAWPSHYNADHKWCFSISGKSRHKQHIILIEPGFMGLMSQNNIELLKIELVERSYQPLFRADQSLSPACEPAIEIICKKGA